MTSKMVLEGQYHVSFYFSWFTRCFVMGEMGWYCLHTPDGRGIMYQDAFFWRCLEIICQELNVIEASKRAKVTNG